MTSQAKTFRDLVLGGIITLVCSLLLMVLTGAWGGKESAADHKADVQALRADIRRVLDVLCTDHPNAPQCKP
jgi:hypothetical protein